MATIVLSLLLPPLLAVYVLVIILVLDTDRAYAQYAIIVPISYILGSIPWGFLIAHVVKGIDLRQYGSGNTGTSNVLRTTGGAFAVVALVLDLTKGLLAVFLARAIVDTPSAEVTAGLAALAGHNWSAFLGLKGGRGIATGLGGLLVMQPLTAVLAMAAFSLVTLPTRYLSLGSIVSVIAAFLSLLAIVLMDQSPATYLAYTGVGGVIIIWRHRDNIGRLLHGTERRLGQRAEGLGEASGTGSGGA